VSSGSSSAARGRNRNFFRPRYLRRLFTNVSARFFNRTVWLYTCYKSAKFRSLGLFFPKILKKNRFLDFVSRRMRRETPTLAPPSGLIYSAIWVKVYETLEWTTMNIYAKFQSPSCCQSFSVFVSKSLKTNILHKFARRLSDRGLYNEWTMRKFGDV